MRGTQSITEKIEALRSLLPLLDDYLELVDSPCTAKVLALDPDDLLAASGPSPEPDDNRDERWIEARDQARRKYRLAAVDQSLASLEAKGPLGARYARAAYYEFVQPWTEYDQDNREDLAEAALGWMAREIPGDVDPFSLESPISTWRARVRELQNDGLSVRQIARATGRSTKSVQSALKAKGSPVTDQAVEERLCSCGCGKATQPASETKVQRGWVKGKPISYINGHNRRALPLTDVERAHVDTLVADNLEWAKKRAKTYGAHYSLDRDDIEGECLLILNQAAHSYTRNARGDAQFRTYASAAIDTGMGQQAKVEGGHWAGRMHAPWITDV